MADVLFPKRQRCKECGKKLESLVVLGLYDSYRCAGMAAPAKTPETAPRECKTERDGVWQFKRRYRSESEIPEKLQQDPSSKWYWCTTSCGNLHIGHSRIKLDTEAQRVLKQRSDLADVLVKARGGATHTQVAKVAGIRPIRLKELEDPKSPSVDLEALFKVLYVYKLKLSVVFKK
jgi:hypothetical protein